jgi:hypothetical protein
MKYWSKKYPSSTTYMEKIPQVSTMEVSKICSFYPILHTKNREFPVL